MFGRATIRLGTDPHSSSTRNVFLYCVPQNVTTSSFYNFDKHQSIFKFLAETLLIKPTIKKCFIFPPHLTSSSAIPGKGKQQKTKVASFHL